MQVVKSDVIVVGSGLAGIAAAIESARAGARVALLTTGTLCGGSSFSKHTWGLGMVTPTDLDAELRRSPESLAYAMESVGAHQNNPQLVDVLIADASSAVAFLSSLGATVSEPSNPNQREFVPCFDTRVRGWHGFHAWDSRAALMQAVCGIEGIQVFEHTRALSFLQEDGRATPIRGVMACGPASCPSSRLTSVELLRFEAPSVVLATGGLASVYEHSFGGEGYLAAAMAYDAGATFTNIEFLQLMLAFCSHPMGAICNEKLWRHASVLDENGSSVFQYLGVSPDKERAALEAHSWHGPFTTARESRLLELAIQRAEAAGHHAYLHLSEAFLDGAHPEFVDTYLDWLREKGANPKEPVEITLYAHSSNGGIDIDADGATTVPGLFAAGECAGGVHGADRIGGLASVTALVFGRRAGIAAACYAREHKVTSSAARPSSPMLPVDNGPFVCREVGKLMGAHCLVNRTDEGLRGVLADLDHLIQDHFGSEQFVDESGDPRSISESVRARAKSIAAHLMAEAMLSRRESLGSHHRSDIDSFF